MGVWAGEEQCEVRGGEGERNRMTRGRGDTVTRGKNWRGRVGEGGTPEGESGREGEWGLTPSPNPSPIPNPSPSPYLEFNCQGLSNLYFLFYPVDQVNPVKNRF